MTANSTSTPVKMIPQAVIDLTTGKKIMEEWLCRPLHGTVEEYFNTENHLTLWEREAACIEEALKSPSDVPKLMNLTLSSLPYFLETNWTWEGGVEIVEWGPRQSFIINSSLPFLLQRIKQRGLKVWVDDLTPETWLIWKYAGVDGFKLSWRVLKEVFSPAIFVREVQSRRKPIIIEWIENRESEEEVKNLGIRFAQGYYYD